jgi:hypothetical protein
MSLQTFGACLSIGFLAEGAGRALFDPVTGPLVDPRRFYLRINPLFETGSPEVAWLNDLVAIGLGRPIANGVQYDVFAVK